MDMNAEPQMQLARVQAEEQQQAQRQAERDRWHDVLRNIKKDYTVLLNKFFVAEDEPVTAYAFSYVDERYEPRRGLPIYNLRQGQAFAEFASGMVALMMQQHDILHSTSLFDEFSWDEHLFVRLPSGGILSIGSLGLEFFDLSNILRVESLGNTFQPVLRVEEEADEDAYDAESLCLELKLLQETRRPSDDGNVFYDDYLAFVETLGSSFTRPLRYSILNSSSPTNGFTFHPSYLGNLFSLPAWGRFLEKLQDVTFFREVELSEDQWNVAARTAFQNVRFVDMRVPVSFPVAAQAQQITWNITGMPAMSPDPYCVSAFEPKIRFQNLFTMSPWQDGQTIT